MSTFQMRTYWCGTLLEIEVDYSLNHYDEIELDEARVIGVYHEGDDQKRRDYTVMSTDIPLIVSDMSNDFYDQLLVKAEEDYTVFCQEGRIEE